MIATNIARSAHRPQQDPMPATEQLYGERAAPTETFPPAFNTSTAGTSVMTAEQVAAFHRDGFVSVQNLSSRAEIESLKEAYDRLFSERRGWDSGDLFDMVGRDDLKKGLSLPQMLWPSRYEPLLRQTALYHNAYAI